MTLRTEAGRSLLTDADVPEMEPPVQLVGYDFEDLRKAILAIEAEAAYDAGTVTITASTEARQPDSEALALLPLDVDWWERGLGARNGSNLGMAEFVVATLRAALAALPLSDPPALDVERLRVAMRIAYDEIAATDRLSLAIDEAALIATNYDEMTRDARLSAQPEVGADD